MKTTEKVLESIFKLSKSEESLMKLTDKRETLGAIFNRILRFASAS